MRGTFECGHCKKQVSDQEGGHFDSDYGSENPFDGDGYGECCYSLAVEFDELLTRVKEAAPKKFITVINALDQNLRSYVVEGAKNAEDAKRITEEHFSKIIGFTASDITDSTINPSIAAGCPFGGTLEADDYPV